MVLPDRSKEAMAMLALHEALRNVCVTFDWTYSVFWTIRPRPRCRGGTNCKVGDENGSLMLMWEDGFCNLEPSQASSVSTVASRLRSHVDDMSCEHLTLKGAADPYPSEELIWKAFRKMSIQLYNYGEGLMGKVASDKCHKWVFKESPECEVGISSYWQSSFDAHPPEWIDQFAAGIQTIAVIQAGQGLLQLGSCKVITEDLHFVLRMRHAFESLDYTASLFLPQSFTAIRNGAPGSIYPNFPPPSPHSWSLSTLSNSLEISARFRAGVLKSTPDAKLNGFDIKDKMARSPRLPLNNANSNLSTLQESKLGHAASPPKTGKEFSSPSPSPQLRDAAMIQEPRQSRDHVVLGACHVASPSNSKLYQRRSNLMPKFHQGLSFLHTANAPTSISSLEAILAQRSPQSVHHSPVQSVNASKKTHEVEELRMNTDQTNILIKQCCSLPPLHAGKAMFQENLHTDQQHHVDHSNNACTDLYTQMMGGFSQG